MTVRTEELKSTLAEAFASIVADSEKKITERIGGLEREASESKAKTKDPRARSRNLRDQGEDTQAPSPKLRDQGSDHLPPGKFGGV